MRIKEGIASWRSKFDGQGNDTEVTYVGRTGKPRANRDGITVCRWKFDDRGNETERGCLDEAGYPLPGQAPVLDQSR